jgi:hypothetical protein
MGWWVGGRAGPGYAGPCVVGLYSDTVNVYVLGRRHGTERPGPARTGPAWLELSRRRCRRGRCSAE